MMLNMPWTEYRVGAGGPGPAFIRIAGFNTHCQQARNSIPITERARFDNARIAVVATMQANSVAPLSGTGMIFVPDQTDVQQNVMKMKKNFALHTSVDIQALTTQAQALVSLSFRNQQGLVQQYYP
jgi:hypothetical protein